MRYVDDDKITSNIIININEIKKKVDTNGDLITRINSFFI